MPDSILIYCDGACSGNPGPGGWGSIVIAKNRVLELGDGDPATTNNRMEMSAVLGALNYCVSSYKKGDLEKIRVFTDSVYVIRGITQWIFGWKKRGWKNAANEAVSNQDIWEKLDQTVNAVKKQLDCEIQWSFVKGHSGVAGNERCDEIAVAFSKHTHIELYDGDPAYYGFDVNILPPEKDLPEPKKAGAPGEKKEAWYLSYVNGVLTRHKTWKECEAVVKGRPAKFKKVTSSEEESSVKKSWGL